MICTCGQIKVGGRPTGNRNLNLSCEEHGVDSVWYNSPEQVERRKIQNERVRDLQLRAREAMRKFAKDD